MNRVLLWTSADWLDRVVRMRMLTVKADRLVSFMLSAMCLGFSPAAIGAEPIASTNLHNAFAVTPKIFSGSAPDNEASFAELVKLGVKTIISVDGSKPDVETAKKYGLRYVHIPFGYDGIPTNRVTELVAAAQTVTGPIYVHCHHGKHRGPAAVAVICEATAGWGTNTAAQWLQQAGTSADYSGLYQSARDFKFPASAELAAVKLLPEVAATSSFVDAMVAIDERFDRLKAAQKTARQEIPRRRDTSAHEATLLWEQFREAARMREGETRPVGFRKMLSDAEQAADRFRLLLKEHSRDEARVNDAFTQIGQSCTACHRKYRD